MRPLLFLSIFILCQLTSAQDNVADLNAYLKTVERVTAVTKLPKRMFKSANIITSYTELDRSLDFGYKHFRALIVPGIGGDIKINLISKNGEIIVGWTSEYNTKKQKHSRIIAFKDSIDFINKYISDHNKFYSTKLQASDFREQIMAEHVVGFGCGFVGLDIPESSRKVLVLIKRKNTKMLNELLTSFSPELQTLGAIGLLKTNKVNEVQQKVILHLEERNSAISSCSGCLYGLGETFNDRIAQYKEKS